MPHFSGQRLATIKTSDINTLILTRQADVIVSGEGEGRTERHVSNGEINREANPIQLGIDNWKCTSTSRD
jgi:hypothetical protein